MLRHIARYTEYRKREARLTKQDDEEDHIKERPEDLPDGVPSKATITVKEINDNRYYWQWRDGNKMHSKYKGLVNLDE